MRARWGHFVQGSAVNVLVSALAGNSLCLGPQGAPGLHQRLAGLCRGEGGRDHPLQPSAEAWLQQVQGRGPVSEDGKSTLPCS